MAQWLVKTEPEECSIDDLAGRPDRPVVWEGVRNYQARNFLREMRDARGEKGDRFIYSEIGGGKNKSVPFSGLYPMPRAA